MAADPARAKSLFLAVAALSPEERAAYLNRECGDDAELRARVEALLRADDDAGTVGGAAPTHDYVDPKELAGTVIAARYRLVERIGQGGMGSVWVAQQSEPVKRKVAIKLIKPGMDSRQVINRFEAERQALALMDHPNIATVLDGGVHEGRPYFAMELVKGVPITEYCDARKLSPKERLELFVPVCQAIQHAHQKGIIHRDIKPSNVLIALYDDKPVPKVIDFGVAKATGGVLTEATIDTGFGGVVGTPQYMSPEQATLNNLDIDTRSDVYSLGVLLYELLAGAPPFSREALQRRGLLEMLRVVREEDPPKPSTKLSTDEALPSISANRSTEPAKLTKLLRNELDWIVMKALEKDRARRYETANGFAADVNRYLAGEPVLAHPPSAAYRMKKFMRRYRGQVIAASLILLTLLAGIVGTSTGMFWAFRERDAKAKALVAETKAKDNERQAREKTMAALRDMTAEIVENQMARAETLTEENKEFLRRIIKHYEGLATITGDDAESRVLSAEGHHQVASMRHRLGELQDAERGYRVALRLLYALSSDYPSRPDVLRLLGSASNRIGLLLGQIGQFGDAESLYREAIAVQRELANRLPTQPDLRGELASSLGNLAVLLQSQGRQHEAEAIHMESISIARQLAREFPTSKDFQADLASCLDNLCALFIDMGRLKDAEINYRDVIATRRRLVNDHPSNMSARRQLASTQNNFARLLASIGHFDEAESVYHDSVSALRTLAAEFPAIPELRHMLAVSITNLANLLAELGRIGEAEAAYLEALALQKKLATAFPSTHEFSRHLAQGYNNLGLWLLKLKRLPEARIELNNALELFKGLVTEYPTHNGIREELGQCNFNLGNALLRSTRFDEAESALQDALVIQQKLVADSPTQPSYRVALAGTHTALAATQLESRRYLDAVQHLDAARPHLIVALDSNPHSPVHRIFYFDYLTVLMMAQVYAGNTTGAMQSAQQIRDLGWDPPNDAYNAACALARCIPIVEKDDQLDDAQRETAKQFYADEAMKMLHDALAKGYTDAAHMRQDTDLDPLRDRDDFKKLVENRERKGD